MITSIKESALELYSFLKDPTDQKSPDQTISAKIKCLLSVLAIDLVLFLVIITPLFQILEQTGWVDMETHALAKSMKELPVWLFLFLGAILAPILEEFVFRTLLTFKRNYPIKLLTAGAGIGGKRIKAKVNSYVKRKWRVWYRSIFYLVAIFFAYVHLTNFELTATILLLSPLLVLPQFLAGLLFGYIRVRIGLLWSIYLHSLHNFILIGTGLWFMHQAVEKLDIKTEAYKIKVEEAAIKGMGGSRAASGASTVTFLRVKLEDVLHNLLKIEKKLLKFNDPAKADLLLDIHFTQWTDTINREQIILEHLQEVYKFKITRENRLSTYYDLILTDSLLLQKHRSPIPDTAKTFQSIAHSYPENLTLENTHLPHLLQNLNQKYNRLIVSEKGFSGLYNIILPSTEFANVQQHLRQVYGLSLIPKEKEFEYAVIDF